jgi:hypothetical protein
VQGDHFTARQRRGRHIELLFRHWEERAKRGELGPSSLQKFHSFLKTFAGWIGKPNLVKPIGAYISDPALYTRSYAAEESKSWRAKGVDVRELIGHRRIRRTCRPAAVPDREIRPALQRKPPCCARTPTS